MKAVSRQTQLELSGGSTPDLWRTPGSLQPTVSFQILMVLFSLTNVSPTDGGRYGAFAMTEKLGGRLGPLRYCRHPSTFLATWAFSGGGGSRRGDSGDAEGGGSMSPRPSVGQSHAPLPSL